jgi:hypothetical protein
MRGARSQGSRIASNYHNENCCVGSAFHAESFTYTPTADESDARLTLASAQISDSPLYGPIITDMSIVQSPAFGLGSGPAP